MSDIRNYEEFRAQVLDSLGEDYTVEDLRNSERWRLKVLEGLQSISPDPDPEAIKEAVEDWLDNHPEVVAGMTEEEVEALLDEALATKADKDELGLKADAIVETATGEIASFDDGGDDMPLKSLVVNITPKQSGTGDPSPDNIRTISGYEGVNVNVKGKNILPNTLTSQTLNGTTFTKNADGSVTISGTPSAKVTVILSGGDFLVQTFPTVFSYGVPMPTGTRIYCKATSTSGTVTYPTISSNSDPYVILSTSGATLNNLAIEINTSFNGTPFTIYPMIELSSTATDYVPYEGETKSITLPQTVYGGTLDVVSGVLTITKRFFNLAFDDMNNSESYPGWKSVTGLDECFTSNATNLQAFMSNMAKPNARQIDINAQYKIIYLVPSQWNVSGQAEMKTTYTGQYLQLVFNLLTPTTVQLTPTEVKSLLGDNNVWSDSGTVEVEYRADTTLAFNKLLARIEALES